MAIIPQPFSKSTKLTVIVFWYIYLCTASNNLHEEKRDYSLHRFRAVNYIILFKQNKTFDV